LPRFADTKTNPLFETQQKGRRQSSGPYFPERSEPRVGGDRLEGGRYKYRVNINGKDADRNAAAKCAANGRR
jgi:hypothetical protein